MSNSGLTALTAQKIPPPRWCALFEQAPASGSSQWLSFEVSDLRGRRRLVRCHARGTLCDLRERCREAYNISGWGQHRVNITGKTVVGSRPLILIQAGRVMEGDDIPLHALGFEAGALVYAFEKAVCKHCEGAIIHATNLLDSPPPSVPLSPATPSTQSCAEDNRLRSLERRLEVLEHSLSKVLSDSQHRDWLASGSTAIGLPRPLKYSEGTRNHTTASS
mmetsp:Transcript_52018/g.111226  ORF Transcript_52018/g.111226 Transcript_52018/m.111226 type:complete len:220 (+) Transcript_52018:130-789(+)